MIQNDIDDKDNINNNNNKNNIDNNNNINEMFNFYLLFFIVDLIVFPPAFPVEELLPLADEAPPPPPAINNFKTFTLSP